MSFVAMFIVITDFGLTTIMVRDVSRNNSKINDYLVNLSFLKVIL
jgi:O-antigen/teichoic acid export membrane protein